MIRAYLQTNFVNERGTESNVSTKGNQFFWFNYDNVQLLDILNFQDEAAKHFLC